MLDSRQAFKTAFLYKCATAGLSLEETEALAKQATKRIKEAGIQDQLTGAAMAAGSGTAKTLGNVGMLAALLGPPVAGGIGGYLLGSSGNVGSEDVEDAKKREQIEEYKKQTARLLAKDQLRPY